MFFKVCSGLWGHTESLKAVSLMVSRTSGSLLQSGFNNWSFLPVFNRSIFIFMTMPLKRSSETHAQDEVFLIHSLTKSLCSSPEDTDLKKQSLLQQEDDSGIKSGNLGRTLEFQMLLSHMETLQTLSFLLFFLCLDTFWICWIKICLIKKTKERSVTI